MGANMAETNVSTAVSAGAGTVSRAGSASGSTRTGALRPVSAVAPTSQSFSQTLATPRSTEIEDIIVPALEPGTGRLSSVVQLMLAETRAQEDQSDFLDKAILDQATSSYAQSQASVRETIGLTQLANNGVIPKAAGETSA